MMKVSRQFLLCILMLVSEAAVSDDDYGKIILHINDIYKIAHLRNSVINIRREMGESVDIKVVVNGKAVTRLLRTNVESAKIIKSILNQGVSIGLCHNAVSNNKVKPEMLIEGLNILESDGNVTIYDYKKQGYSYIKL